MGTILQVNSITKHYGLQKVFDGASITIAEKQKIGVMGRNGSGKSTLFRMIVDEETPDTGEIIRYPDLRLGYLEQQPAYLPTESGLSFLMRSSGKPDWQCAKIASRFQLTNELLEKPIGELSGGYQMRLKLAAMLLPDPNFLLLDEPTNYLDLTTLLLLEHFLRSFRGGYLVISHDREFLKRTCNSTLEVGRGKCILYPGDIEAYLAYQEAELERIQNENDKTESKRKHLQKFVDRFRYKASLASQAQSKLKQIARLKKIEVERPMSTMRIKIPVDKIKKGVALRVEDLAIGYPDKTVASGLTFDIERGSHVAILGDNGQGKSTLLKTIAGQLPQLTGEYRWGPDLKIAYYAQHVYTALDPKDRVDKYLSRMAAPGVTEEEILRMAGNFLFRDDELEKQISVLSGGERARLCLAGLLLSKSQVFLFDEPTNHLDFETVEALGRTLKEYPGTIFFVSHNRTFVNLIATVILEVKDGKLTRYNGSYQDYVADLEQRLEAELPKQSKPVLLRPEQNESDVMLIEKSASEQSHEARKRQNKVNKELRELEAERDSILTEMGMNPTAYSRTLNERLRNAQETIKQKENEWLEVQRSIDWLDGK